jgi:hypothetical protein
MSVSFVFLAFNKRITGRISYSAGFSIFLNIANTQYDEETRFSCLQMVFLPSQRTNKICMHAHHRDRSAAAAIFANGTYFVDTPRTYSHLYWEKKRTWINWVPSSMSQM